MDFDYQEQDSYYEETVAEIINSLPGENYISEIESVASQSYLAGDIGLARALLNYSLNFRHPEDVELIVELYEGRMETLRIIDEIGEPDTLVGQSMVAQGLLGTYAARELRYILRDNFTLPEGARTRRWVFIAKELMSGFLADAVREKYEKYF